MAGGGRVSFMGVPLLSVQMMVISVPHHCLLFTASPSPQEALQLAFQIDAFLCECECVRVRESDHKERPQVFNGESSERQYTKAGGSLDMCSGLWGVVLVLAATTAVLGASGHLQDQDKDDSKHPAGLGTDGGGGLSPVRTKRLTAFGKTANVPSPAPPLSAGIVVGATGIKECRTAMDCEMIQYTECRTDPREGRSVCLCMDNALPVNGACSARPRDTRGYVPFGNRKPNKALRTPCNSDNECLEGAECVINPNATVNINQRMCYCMPGWLEVEGYCNGSSISSASILFTLTFAALLITYSQI